MNIYESITKVMSESIAIGKNSYNEQQKFKYRSIDAVMNTFYPLFAKHKVFIVPEVLEQLREERTTRNGGNLIYSILKVKYTFYAEDGSSISATVIGEGMDSADKASNKAMAVAMKYAMFQVFCIPTEEFIDPDGDTPPESKKKEEPKQEPTKPLTLEDAKAMEINIGDKTRKLGELTNKELLAYKNQLRDNPGYKAYFDAICLILTDKARTGEMVDAERKDN